MNKNLKIILIELMITIIFFISFGFYYNDFLLYSFIAIIFGFILIINLLYLFFYNKNKKLNIILRKYSDILIHISNVYNFNIKNVILVNKFSDLLVAHHRLDEPILYYYRDDYVNFFIKDEKILLTYKLFI